MRLSPESPTLSRRSFLRATVVGSAVSMVTGSSWAGIPVAAVEPVPAGEPGLLRLRIADFEPFQASFGAVRLSFAALGQVSPMAPFIVSKDDTDFFAVSAECTHQSCLIPAFGSAKTSTCPCHGSRFGHDGRVIRGPASDPLSRYDTSVDEPGFVRIFIPEFPAYEVTIQKVLSLGTPRVRLQFRSLSNVEYEVLHRSATAADWTPQSFALTEGGVADRTVVKGNGGDQAVFVESVAPGGLFTVSAKVRKV